ncbi:hypothetical protein IAQ61_005793 [Plenodomus lingam]|uniref:uncharacterized protein n=1 Tax=Leptosphaeria maculans TaxID=5022 RepID=UPI0033188044|nr:hypothetical protein IAQ61_005793 [Plenodomus lingam]
MPQDRLLSSSPNHLVLRPASRRPRTVRLLSYPGIRLTIRQSRIFRLSIDKPRQQLCLVPGLLLDPQPTPG